MEEGLGPNLSFYGPLFARCHFIRHLVLELLVLVLNESDLLEIGAIGLVLKDLLRGCQNRQILIRVVVDDHMGQGYNTILGLDNMNGDLFERSEPSSEEFGLVEGG
jgi:hypothetical protein